MDEESTEVHGSLCPGILSAQSMDAFESSRNLHREYKRLQLALRLLPQWHHATSTTSHEDGGIQEGCGRSHSDRNSQHRLFGNDRRPFTRPKATGTSALHQD